MPKQPNPYEPPPAPKRAPSQFDRTVLGQTAVGVQIFTIVGYCIVTSYSERNDLASALESNLLFNGIIAGCAISGFLVVCVSVLTKSQWPLHLRVSMVGIDAMLVAVLAWVSHGFGAL